MEDEEGAASGHLAQRGSTYFLFYLPADSPRTRLHFPDCQGPSMNQKNFREEGELAESKDAANELRASTANGFSSVSNGMIYVLQSVVFEILKNHNNCDSIMCSKISHSNQQADLLVSIAIIFHLLLPKIYETSSMNKCTIYMLLVK